MVWTKCVDQVCGPSGTVQVPFIGYPAPLSICGTMELDLINTPTAPDEPAVSGASCVVEQHPLALQTSSDRFHAQMVQSCNCCHKGPQSILNLTTIQVIR